MQTYDVDHLVLAASPEPQELNKANGGADLSGWPWGTAEPYGNILLYSAR